VKRNRSKFPLENRLAGALDPGQEDGGGKPRAVGLRGRPLEERPCETALVIDNLGQDQVTDATLNRLFARPKRA